MLRFIFGVYTGIYSKLKHSPFLIGRIIFRFKFKCGRIVAKFVRFFYSILGIFLQAVCLFCIFKYLAADGVSGRMSVNNYKRKLAIEFVRLAAVCCFFSYWIIFLAVGLVYRGFIENLPTVLMRKGPKKDFAIFVAAFSIMGFIIYL